MALAVALVRAIIALHQNGPARSGLNWQASLAVSSISAWKFATCSARCAG